MANIYLLCPGNHALPSDPSQHTRYHRKRHYTKTQAQLSSLSLMPFPFVPFEDAYPGSTISLNLIFSCLILDYSNLGMGAAKHMRLACPTLPPITLHVGKKSVSHSLPILHLSNNPLVSTWISPQQAFLQGQLPQESIDSRSSEWGFCTRPSENASFLSQHSLVSCPLGGVRAQLQPLSYNNLLSHPKFSNHAGSSYPEHPEPGCSTSIVTRRSCQSHKTLPQGT